MPTIKVEKQLNLPDLITWAWQYNVKERTFTNTKGSIVVFGHKGDVIDTVHVDHSDLFNIEFEEEVTEDTKIPKLYHFTRSGFVITNHNKSVKELISEFPSGDGSLSFYIMNDDLTMTLIWTKEKGMVRS